jgi:hypothetical protein
MQSKPRCVGFNVLPDGAHLAGARSAPGAKALSCPDEELLSCPKANPIQR